MPEYAEDTTERNALNEPVDIALSIALDAAEDARVRELIREAQQHRICAEFEATDEEVRAAVETRPASGGDA